VPRAESNISSKKCREYFSFSDQQKSPVEASPMHIRWEQYTISCMLTVIGWDWLPALVCCPSQSLGFPGSELKDGAASRRCILYAGPEPRKPECTSAGRCSFVFAFYHKVTFAFNTATNIGGTFLYSKVSVQNQ
jgi:hypothetical protein